MHRTRHGERAVLHLQRRPGAGRRGSARRRGPAGGTAAADARLCTSGRPCGSTTGHRPARTRPSASPSRRADCPGRRAMCIVSNSAPWTYLGRRPVRTNPDASFDTGLDLLALRSLGTVATARTVCGRCSPTGPSRRAAGRCWLATTCLRSSCEREPAGRVPAGWRVRGRGRASELSAPCRMPCASSVSHTLRYGRIG